MNVPVSQMRKRSCGTELHEEVAWSDFRRGSDAKPEGAGHQRFGFVAQELERVLLSLVRKTGGPHREYKEAGRRGALAGVVGSEQKLVNYLDLRMRMHVVSGSALGRMLCCPTWGGKKSISSVLHVVVPEFTENRNWWSQRKDDVEGPPHCRRAAADNTMRNIHFRHFRGSQPSSP